jgi:hypothetical protein
MCYQMLPIATYDDRRFISQCEHGTLHMHWGRVMLSFHPDELLLIARTLRRYDPDRRTDLTSPGVSVFWQAPEQEEAQVWLAHVGLMLDAAAVTILLGLLNAASEHLIAGSSALFNQHDLVQMPDFRRAAPAN